MNEYDKNLITALRAAHSRSRRMLFDAAANRLEALLAENERLKVDKDKNVPNKWVSVEERLPELNVMVVGITKDNPFSRYVPQVVHRNEHGWVFTYSMRYVTEVWWL